MVAELQDQLTLLVPQNLPVQVVDHVGNQELISATAAVGLFKQLKPGEDKPTVIVFDLYGTDNKPRIRSVPNNAITAIEQIGEISHSVPSVVYTHVIEYLRNSPTQRDRVQNALRKAGIKDDQIIHKLRHQPSGQTFKDDMKQICLVIARMLKTFER